VFSTGSRVLVRDDGGDDDVICVGQPVPGCGVRAVGVVDLRRFGCDDTLIGVA
jgi:hypothetical protein